MCIARLSRPASYIIINTVKLPLPPTGSMSTEDAHHGRAVVYLRFPFPRNGFQDPPTVEWDHSKEKLLWEHLSRTTNKADVDWTELAQQFGVSVPFLLQQAAWLYEKELQQVRAQMRRVRKSLKPTAASPETSSGPRGHVPRAHESLEHSSFTVTGRDISRGAPHKSPTPTYSPERSGGSALSDASPGGNVPESRRLLSMSRNFGGQLDDSGEDFEGGFMTVEKLSPATGTKSTPLSSSLTDLSEISVSQSALEEALNDLSVQSSSTQH